MPRTGPFWRPLSFDSLFWAMGAVLGPFLVDVSQASTETARGFPGDNVGRGR